MKLAALPLGESLQMPTYHPASEEFGFIVVLKIQIGRMDNERAPLQQAHAIAGCI
jgi:hypothetical protein